VDKNNRKMLVLAALRW